MIREIQQMKDQFPILIPRTSTDISELDHIDQVFAQIASNTVLILQHPQQLCSGFSQSRTRAGSVHAWPGKTADGLHQLSLELENILQSHVINEKP